MKVQPKNERVYRFMSGLRHAPAYRWGEVTDPRHKRGRRWSMAEQLDALLFGMLTGSTTLRDVEGLTEDACNGDLWGLRRRLPDTTMYRLIPKLNPEELRDKLRQQNRLHFRAKRYEPEGLPCGVVTIDGKCGAVLEHDALGQAQRSHQDGHKYYLLRFLRAVLTSSPARPCLDQQVIAASTNDMGAFEAFWPELLAAYDSLELFDIATVDSGFCSLKNATLIHESDKAYVMALKDNQPELIAEAKRLLEPMKSGPAEVETDWERAQGRWLKRQLYRTFEIEGYLDWYHLKQAWLVVQTSKTDSGEVSVEERYFITSVRRGRLSPKQSLQVVRGHWGIENDCNWSFDTQWEEDDMHWCRKSQAVVVLGVLRSMAYNVIQILRTRHLRRRREEGRREDPPPFRRLFEWLKQALLLSTLGGMNPAKVG